MKNPSLLEYFIVFSLMVIGVIVKIGGMKLEYKISKAGQVVLDNKSTEIEV